MPKSAHLDPCHQRPGSHRDSPRGPSEEGALSPTPRIDGALFPRRTRVGQQVPHAGQPPEAQRRRLESARPGPPRHQPLRLPSLLPRQALTSELELGHHLAGPSAGHGAGEAAMDSLGLRPAHPDATAAPERDPGEA